MDFYSKKAVFSLNPRTKPRSNRCQCGVCREYFGGVRAFDMHRVGPVGERTCMTPHRMSERGLRCSSEGYWIQE